jgi:hypothetical protein
LAGLRSCGTSIVNEENENVAAGTALGCLAGIAKTAHPALRDQRQSRRGMRFNGQ